MSLSTFTSVHVVVSLIGMVAGFLVLAKMLGARKPAALTALFLLATTATSVTGFMFPLTRIGLGQIVGALSLTVLLAAIVALYVHRLAGPWRRIYVSGVVTALYLNVLIGVAQAFGKIDVLRQLAPTRSAPAFLLAQLAVLAIFVVLGALAARRFRPGPSAPPPHRHWQAGPSAR